MADLPKLDMVRIRRWADEEIPEHVRDDLPVSADVGLPRPGRVEKLKAAQLRYEPDEQHWTLHWFDPNGR